MLLVIIGLALGGLGGYLTWRYMKLQKKLTLITTTKTSRVRELKELCQKMSSDGTNSYVQNFNYFAELKGKGVTDEPLEAQISNRKCLYYKIIVEREREEVSYVNTRNGRSRRKRKVWDLISQNEFNAEWYLKDATGEIRVNTKGSEMDGLITTVDKYEPIVPSGSGFGDALINILTSMTTSDKILGYRTREYILPVDSRLYILGNVSNAMGFLQIQNLIEKDKKFFISTKSETRLVNEYKKSINMQVLGSYISFAIGIILIIVGLFPPK